MINYFRLFLVLILFRHIILSILLLQIAIKLNLNDKNKSQLLNIFQLKENFLYLKAKNFLFSTSYNYIIKDNWQYLIILNDYKIY